MTTVTAVDGHEFAVHTAQPSGNARGLVVVVQEIFGVNEHIRSVADRYAELGYMAVARHSLIVFKRTLS